MSWAVDLIEQGYNPARHIQGGDAVLDEGECPVGDIDDALDRADAEPNPTEGRDDDGHHDRDPGPLRLHGPHRHH